MSGIRLSTLVRRLRRNGSSGDGTDADLLARFARGRDDAAFEFLVWRHGAMVLGACRRALGNSEDAEDAFQATFLVLARKAGTVSRGVALPAWLHRVAIRIASRLSRKRRPVASLEVDLARPLGADPVERADELAVLDEEIDRLPERCRRAVVLCYLEGLTAAEAGRQLGCPTGTVESRLAAARKILRDSLTRRGITLPVGALAVVSGQGVLAPEAVAMVVRAAVAFVREGAASAAGVVNPSSVKLAQGVLAMGYTRWWVGAAIVVVAVAASAAGVWADREAPAAVADDPPAAKPADAAVAPPPVAKGEAPATEDAWPFARRVWSVSGTWQGFSPDGRSLIFVNNTSVARYDLDSSSLRVVVQSPNVIADTTISPDGNRIATAEGVDGVKIRDAITGKVLEAFWPSAGIAAKQVAFTQDGSRLIALCWRGTTIGESKIESQISVWDLTFQKEIGWPATSMSSPDLRLRGDLAAGGRFVRVVEQINGRSEEFGYRLTLIDPLVGGPGKASKFRVSDFTTLGTSDVGLSPDGKGMLASDGHNVLIFDPSTGKERLRLGRLAHIVNALAYSPDGKRVAAASATASSMPWRFPPGEPELASPTEIVIWDAATGKELARLVDKESIRNYDAVRFSPDGSYLVAQYGRRGGGSSGTEYSIWGHPPVAVPKPVKVAAAKPASPSSTASTTGVPDRFQSLIRDLSADGVADSQRVERVFMAALGRLPTEVEARLVAIPFARQTDKAAALHDLFAALVDTAEFRDHLAALQQIAKPTPPPTTPPSTTSVPPNSKRGGQTSAPKRGGKE